ncbi:hypothetical protein [Vulcanisaeta sp. JCM 14467]|uniref:hypothetical protein n=1 Tax=Vulcanisaeta sp. JCM 14467 TaxID=1295370 RepID=UPI0006D09B05|nr:hypothetical protein [Vulcanisaeta sp. JCM 14467]
MTYQVYDPSINQWVEVGKEVADEIAERGRSVVGGFMPNGFHLVLAIPRRRLGPYGKYVVEWVDKVPRRPLLVNEGVKIVYKGRRGDTEYFEAKPL